MTLSQALTWARIEAQYKNINEQTIGIVFFGTPHRGGESASYGNVLTNIATNIMPASRLVSALQTNSDQLMRLASEFKFQLSKYQIVSFYELRPMSSSLVSLSAKK
jgi:hypothetical protein